jgi:hypothetical protein
MMSGVTAFYIADGADRFLPQDSTAGPWGPHSQHGGPPAALLTHGIEQLARDQGRVIGRLTMELLGPVPLSALRLTAAVVRPGRSVEMCEAILHDEERGRPCARATAWLFPASTDGPGQYGVRPSHTPSDGRPHDRPAGWSGGYLDAVEWRWISGAVLEAGPAVVWMRPAVELIDGRPMTPVQRLMSCVDSASGVSAALDPAEWGFLNTELTVHVLRPPVGEWVCLDAATTLGTGSVGIASSRVYDEQGLVAHSAQALLVVPRDTRP